MNKQYDKQYNYKDIDKAMQRLWALDGTYAFDPNGKGKLYSIDTPPPTVSGSLHMGHIFSYTQAEIVARSRRMTGHNVFYPFGFDDNGLPTERLVEREEGIQAKNVSREEFAAKCLATVGKYTEQFTELWKSLGFCCDWNTSYSTISEEVRRLSQREFLRLIDTDDAYVKKAPILWCTACATSIAQAELEDKVKNTHFHTLVFDKGRHDIQIATTRPEYLGGCVAVLVNPEDTRFGKLVGKTLRVPLYNHEVPVIADELVKIDKGTGVVMCCTFGDSTDMEWVAKYNLPVVDVLEPNGLINSEIDFIGGLKVGEARRTIVELLNNGGLLIESKQIEHTVAVHDRCGMPSEIITSKQWYIRALKYKKDLLKYGSRVKWNPEHMYKRYEVWVTNLKWDWCVSRQRFFGVPIPVWYCDDCGKTIAADIDSLPVNPISDKPRTRCACGSDSYTPETSVLDTWATSSITPKIIADTAKKMGYEGKFLPCSMRTHAHEIIRTWSFYTILRSYLADKQIPWKELMICGFVLAGKGEKISKSKNNAIYDPVTLLANYPADTIRYCAASTKLGTDTYFSDKELDEASRMLTKLWNVFKYVAMQLDGYTPKKPKELLPIDKWIIGRAQRAMNDVRSCLNGYEAGLGKQAVTGFFWGDFCDNFVEISKSRIYNNDDKFGVANSNSAKYALYTSFLYIQRMLAIYMPHITEFVYQELYAGHEKVTSLHRTKWDKKWIEDTHTDKVGAAMVDIVSAVRKFKSERGLSLRVPVAKINITVPSDIIDDIKLELADLYACTFAEEITVDEGGLAVIVA